MIKFDLPSIYDKLSTRTHDYVSNINNSICPYLVNPYIARVVGNVFGDTNNIKVNDVVFQTTSIPYFKIKRKNFNDTLLNLIESEEIYPFIIFINGRVIPLNSISIYKISNRNYIYIKNIKLPEYFEVKFLIIPSKIIYKEGAMDTSELKSYKERCNDNYLNFNSSGYYASEFELSSYYMFIGIINNKIKKIDGTINQSNIVFDHNYHIAQENVLLFTKISGQENYFELYSQNIDDKGLNIFSTISTSDRIVAKAFVSDIIEQPLDRVHNITEYGINNIKENIKNNMASDSERKLAEKFNPINNSTIDFVSDSIVYNTQILNDIIKENRSIEIIKSEATKLFKNGKYEFNKKGKRSNRDFLMFTNNDGLRLIDITYSMDLIVYLESLDGKCIVTSGALKGSKDVELLIFKNISTVDDVIKDIEISSDGSISIPEDFDIDNYEVFSRYNNNKSFNVDNEDISYKLPVLLVRDKDNKTKALLSKTSPTFNTSWYINNNYKIDLVPKNLYIHDCIPVYGTISDSYYNGKINLNPSLYKYCKDINRFIVFRNGLKVDSTEYKIVFPTQTTAFSDISIYFNKEFILNEDTYVDIVYAPMEFIEEKINIDIVNPNGLIELDIKNKNISKETCLFFINGRKIPDEDIDILYSDKIRIKNAESTKHVSIIRFIDINDNLIDSILKNIEINENSMYNIMNNLIEEGKLESLYGNINNITNSQTDIKTGLFNMKAILHEIVRNYYMKSGFTTDEPFLFDYDNSYFVIEDENGNTVPDKDNRDNIIIRTMDANEKTNLPE